MTITELTTYTAAPVEHPVSITSAAATLDVQPQTIRRYLRAGKLDRLGDGVSAASVHTYAERRAANITRTRAVPGWHRRRMGRGCPTGGPGAEAEGQGAARTGRGRAGGLRPVRGAVHRRADAPGRRADRADVVPGVRRGGAAAAYRTVTEDHPCRLIA
ncbi:hypothetical protein FRACA_170045 [Frankia canadensis]|uniref:Uncharacterized protein n=1 Tax=Frankia canadensis TaxID=1836972 RepID=A0A2I2KN48_9ACTN|nr:hypothetical protein FRACA_170045 [Frankia canadensis]SOU54375.1 hypothetical protein FRACA_170045 [Frankia canadensis]